MMMLTENGRLKNIADIKAQSSYIWSTCPISTFKTRLLTRPCFESPGACLRDTQLKTENELLSVIMDLYQKIFSKNA